uniref:Uncharacterized protein n=1 Tax=Romanomermis culicivorax TaxID=13658 RepID=A0A915JF92_ROMCU
MEHVLTSGAGASAGASARDLSQDGTEHRDFESSGIDRVCSSNCVQIVYIYVRNKNICGSPFSLMVRQGRDYSTVGANPLFSFATEGQAEGQLYRPWGIACDKLSRIVVSDRGNNRIQIFDQKGNFLTTFGREGKGDGEFKKPAGLAINNNNEIIVVDKDNHRIQVFTAEGKFIFAFGEEGLLCGQFNYPWDCAVNNAGCIAVSDTRNHRIQLFDSKGSFVRKFPFDFGEPRRNLHSNKGQASTPRGLVFTQDGRLLVTDFNHHRLIVIYPDNSDHARAYGTLGEGNFNFNRPQGIDVDLDGTILLCDGKNNRCQVFTPQLEFLGCFGTENERSVMKTPCDLCVTPEGRVFVVDFDNSMIRCLGEEI